MATLTVGTAMAMSGLPAEALSARAQQQDSDRTEHCVVLCPTYPHTTLHVYIKPFLCFPFQKECCQLLEADVFINLRILKSDMKSAASGAAEKHAVTTLEGASQWGRWGAGKALPKATRCGKIKLKLNIPFPSTLFSIGRGVQTTNWPVFMQKRTFFSFFFKFFKVSPHSVCLENCSAQKPMSISLY